MEKKLINKKHNILDCTFRDGGYYNNWHFNITLIKKYISIMLKLDVKIVELGFRFIETNENNFCLYIRDSSPQFGSGCGGRWGSHVYTVYFAKCVLISRDK